MLGHRGVRLGLSFPEIYSMQISAVLEAAAECRQEGFDVYPEIMVPQVCTAQELKRVKSFVDAVHSVVEEKYSVKVDFKFGSMMEVVRSCMRAGSLAEEAEFFSFGTNDLTQATFSFSREDAENKFLPMYNELGILQDNPFEVLDIEGVGKLMKLAVDWGRTRRASQLYPFLSWHRAELCILLRATCSDSTSGSRTCRPGECYLSSRNPVTVASGRLPAVKSCRRHIHTLATAGSGDPIIRGPGKMRTQVLAKAATGIHRGEHAHQLARPGDNS
jgi:hypothetical protein